MTHFPVTNSNLSATHIGLFLQEKYSLSKDTKCKLIKAGINDTYLVTDNSDKFVFRVYSLNWRSKMEIDEEIKLLNLLKENSISISYPLTDKESNYIQTLGAPEGDRFGVLFTFASGEKQHIISEETHFQIGELMARIHKITHNQKLNRIDYSPEVILIDSLKKVSSFLTNDTEEMTFMKSAQSYLYKEFENADISQIRQGVVHLDIWFDNLNITNDNKVTIFDFDFCGNGWLCLDIAYYVLQLHNIEKYEAKYYQPKVDHFLNGYESVTPLTVEEKRLIPMLGVSLYFFYLGVQCQRYENWSNSFLSENYLKRFINGLVKRYYDIYKLGENQKVTTYHILNGDCLADQLRQTKINQDFIVCRECLIEGNVNADTITDFWTIRAKYFADTYHVSIKEYFSKTVIEMEKLNDIPDNSEVCLWFENDLFCQVNMWFVISMLANHPTCKIFRVFPVIENDEDIWKGFGVANTEKLEQAYESKIPFGPDDIELGKNLWTAYQNGDFDKLNKLAKSPSDCFEYLEEVCQAHADRFPLDKSLGRPDQVVKEIIETKSKEFQIVFSEFAEREGMYGFSDVQVKNIYDRHISSQ